MFWFNKEIWIVSYKSDDNYRKEVAILAKSEYEAIYKFLKNFRSKINYSGCKEGESYYDIRKVDVYE